MHERRLFGNAGEDLAVAYFEHHGFRVVERNWLCRLGEIDVIIEKNGCTHFVEVKTRRSREFGYPEESITGKKLRHLARTIEVYLTRTQRSSTRYQVDALAITVLPGVPIEYWYVERIL